MTLRLCLLGFVRRFSFLQGLLGARSPKPTELLACRAPGLERCFAGLRSARCERRLERIEGQRLDTAPLKTYSPRMCMLQVAGAWHGIAVQLRGLDEANAALDAVLPRLRDAGLRTDSDLEADTAGRTPPDDWVAGHPELGPLAAWPNPDACIGPDYARSRPQVTGQPRTTTTAQSSAAETVRPTACVTGAAPAHQEEKGPDGLTPSVRALIAANREAALQKRRMVAWNRIETREANRVATAITHDGPAAQAFLNSYSLDFISRTSAEERTAMYDRAAEMDEAAAAAAAEAPL